MVKVLERHREGFIIMTGHTRQQSGVYRMMESPGTSRELLKSLKA